MLFFVLLLSASSVFPLTAAQLCPRLSKQLQPLHLQSHLFSLGMTLWLAVQYSGVCSNDLRTLLADMTAERYEERPDSSHVRALCERALHGMSADIICNEIAAAARWDTLAAGLEGER